MTVEQAIKYLRSAIPMLTWLLNTAVQGLEEGVKQGIISPSDTISEAKKKIPDLRTMLEHKP